MFSLRTFLDRLIHPRFVEGHLCNSYHSLYWPRIIKWPYVVAFQPVNNMGIGYCLSAPVQRVPRTHKANIEIERQLFYSKQKLCANDVVECAKRNLLVEK